MDSMRRLCIQFEWAVAATIDSPFNLRTWNGRGNQFQSYLPLASQNDIMPRFAAGTDDLPISFPLPASRFSV
jgi:hypothetical protein